MNKTTATNSTADRRVVISVEFKIDPDCHQSYPATVIDVLLRDRADEHIRSWSVLSIDERGGSEGES